MRRLLEPLTAPDWLTLAATPAFLLMAFLTALAGDHHAAATCSQTARSSLIDGMVPMYLLMAAIHLAPWFRIGRQAGG